MPLRHLMTWISSQVWAMEPTKMAEIMAYLSRRAVYDVDKDAERIHPSKERSIRAKDGKVVVVPMFGIMAQRRMPGESTGPGVPTEATGRLIDSAVADPSTKAIILQIDSPGGAVEGTIEFAAKVRAARDIKPVIAQVDSLAASAAYWVASQATEIVSTPSGSVGSIGVRAVHEDVSAALEAEGIKITMLSAGKYKTEGHPFGPLDDDAREYFQNQIDYAYNDFVGDVAKGRGVDKKTVLDSYGQGRVLLAKQALAAGMIDRIATTEETISRFVANRTSIQRRARAARAKSRI